MNSKLHHDIKQENELQNLSYLIFEISFKIHKFQKLFYF